MYWQRRGILCFALSMAARVSAILAIGLIVSCADPAPQRGRLYHPLAGVLPWTSTEDSTRYRERSIPLWRSSQAYREGKVLIQAGVTSSVPALLTPHLACAVDHATPVQIIPPVSPWERLTGLLVSPTLVDVVVVYGDTFGCRGLVEAIYLRRDTA